MDSVNETTIYALRDSLLQTGKEYDEKVKLN